MKVPGCMRTEDPVSYNRRRFQTVPTVNLTLEKARKYVKNKRPDKSRLSPGSDPRITFPRAGAISRCIAESRWQRHRPSDTANDRIALATACPRGSRAPG